MIKVKNSIATREPIPDFLIGLNQESLADLSWTDPALGAQDCRWLPEIDQSPALGQYERYGTETLTAVDGVVIVTRAVVPWGEGEIVSDLTNKRSNIWSRIKQIRDTKTQQGGYKAQGKWFHSDTFSRSQQIGLVIMGSSIPAGLQWKTMDGSFVEMTLALAQDVFQAAALQDNLLFSYAEQLNQQVQASASPDSIDISQGWPETYKEV